MILFFDCETNGLPKNWQGKITDVDNWPRVISLAYAVYDNDGNLKDHYHALIKPNGWTIPEEKFWIDNGFSTQGNKDNGLYICDVLEEHFIPAVTKCQLLVAHNMKFDMNVVGAECIRLDMKVDKVKKFCTMESSENVCKLPGKVEGKYKWPKLEELYKFLFNEPMDGAHDAMNDVMACAKCFFELRKRNLITV